MYKLKILILDFKNSEKIGPKKEKAKSVAAREFSDRAIPDFR